jgi:DUF4097 and DUF4098 domain-containing protein YvlB
VSDRASTHDGVRRVVVDNFGSGSITVEPGTQPDAVECAIDAADESFLKSVHVRQERDALRISVPPPVFRATDAHLRLGVPPGLEYVIKVGSAEVSVGTDIGRSRIVSGSGDIIVGRATDLDCSTGSGDISVGSVAGSGARLESGSGAVSVGEVRCPVRAKSGSGDVTIASVFQTEVQAKSGSGDIEITSTSGSVDLRSASGTLSIGVSDRLPAWLDLESVSGRLRIGLDSTHPPAPGEAYVSVRARTASGDISVHRA